MVDKAAFVALWDTYLSELAEPGNTNPRRSSFNPDWWEGRWVVQDPKELWELVEILQTLNPQRGLEIGTGCGGSALVWQLFTPLVVSLSIVPREPTFGVLPDEMFPSCIFITADSHTQEALDKVREFAPFDYLFIDGDHDTPAVLMDYEMYSPLVREGGIVAFHDWGYEPVRKAIESISAPKQLIQHSHFGIVLIRK